MILLSILIAIVSSRISIDESNHFSETVSKAISFFLNNLPWEDDKPCSGFFCCKVNKVTYSYLLEWYKCYIPEKNKTHAWEQDALWRLYSDWSSWRIIDSWMFMESPGQFLRHISSWERSLRDVYFRQVIAERELDYELLASQIRCIDIDTQRAFQTAFRKSSTKSDRMLLRGQATVRMLKKKVRRIMNLFHK